MKMPILSWQVALCLVLLVHLVSALLITKLRIDNAPDVYYTPGSPAVVIRDKLRASFPTDELMIVAFQGDDLYQPDFLRRLHGFGLKLEQHPLIDRVSSITSIERISATSDGFSVGPLVDVDTLNRRKPADIFRAVMADRFARWHPKTASCWRWWCSPSCWLTAASARRFATRCWLRWTAPACVAISPVTPGPSPWMWPSCNP